MKKETVKMRISTVTTNQKILSTHGKLQLPTNVVWWFVSVYLCMFVLSVDEIQKFKGCPFPEYFDEPRSTVR